MKYVHVYHAMLGVYVAVPAVYASLVEYWYARYSPTFTEYGITQFGEYIAFDSLLISLPDSFIVR